MAAGSELRMRISKMLVDLRVGRDLEGVGVLGGNSSGEGRLLRRSLKRVVIDGKTVAWDAMFSVKEAGRDYYLIGEGHWQNTEGCDEDQYAHWSFHVKTRA